MQNIPKLQTKFNYTPTTPEMSQDKFQLSDSTTPDLISSPSSVYSLHSPMTPTSPTTQSRLDWSIGEGRGLDDTPVLRRVQSKNAQARQALSRQSSLRRTPSTVKGLKIGKQIGSGSFSKIYEAYGPKGIYAVKIRIPSTSERVFSAEMSILTKLERSEPLTGVPVVKFFPELSDSDHCVLKLYTGTLENLLRSPKYRPNENDFDFFDYRNMIQPICGLDTWCSWAKQLISGLKFIHSKNIVHGDLKPDNVLYSQVNPDEYALAISDFSGAIDLDLNEDDIMKEETEHELAWSPVFTDPKLRNGHELPSFGSDIYALGLVLAFCATGQEPFSSAKNATQRLLWMDKVSPLESFESDVTQRLKLVKPVIELLLQRSWTGVNEALDSLQTSA